MRTQRLLLCHLGILLGAGWLPLRAQTDTLPTQTLSGVTVSVARLEAPVHRVPMAVTTMQVSKLANTYQQLSLQEHLLEVPGLYTMNANNYAQDLRISIRGFGARSAFGIRGVKLVVDGVPETTPDGQGQVDNLDLGIMSRIEVLRGPSSGLYGNASGGVVSIHTLDKLSANFLELGTTVGAYKMQRQQIKGGLAGRKTDLLFNAAWLQTEGYREHSGLRQGNVSANLVHRFNEQTVLKIRTNYTNSPQADDPGALTFSQVQDDRRQSTSNYAFFDAGEAITQFKAAATFEHKPLGRGQLTSMVYFSTRSLFSNQPGLTGGSIDLQRKYGGHSTTYTFPQTWLSGNGRLQVGYEWHFQHDDRKRFSRPPLETPNPLFVHQFEQFTNVGLFALLEWKLLRIAVLHANIRYDYNRLAVKDQLLDNGDASGEVELPAISGGLSLGFPIRDWLNPYVRLATNFETPTLIELTNNPIGDAGLNPSLFPQKGQNLEGGVKGVVRSNFRYELVAFTIRTFDEIGPYTIAGLPGRTFYRNVGQTGRFGIESSLQYAFSKYWRAGLSYTLSRFKFRNNDTATTQLGINSLPGVPKHNNILSLRYAKPRGWLLHFQAQFRGEMYVNNFNSAIDARYTLLQVKVGHEFMVGQASELTCFAGINNLTNKRYNDNIRLNAADGLYYEPAPLLHLYGGVKWRLQGRD
jgi:iron complex outermembrane receptor protein